LPLEYAKEVLDKDHNGSLSIQEASKDVTFQRIIGGNLSLILTENLANGTKLLKPEYNPNKNAYINIDTELTSFNREGKIILLTVVIIIINIIRIIR
jgi:uncharacterized protein